MFFSILGCALYIVNNESKPLWALPCFIKKIFKKTLKKHPKNDLKTGYFEGKNWDKNLIEKKRLVTHGRHAEGVKHVYYKDITFSFKCYVADVSWQTIHLKSSCLHLKGIANLVDELCCVYLVSNYTLFMQVEIVAMGI